MMLISCSVQPRVLFRSTAVVLFEYGAPHASSVPITALVEGLRANCCAFSPAGIIGPKVFLLSSNSAKPLQAPVPPAQPEVCEVMATSLFPVGLKRISLPRAAPAG